MKRLLLICILVFVVCCISLILPYSSYEQLVGTAGTTIPRTKIFGNDEWELTIFLPLGVLIVTLISCIRKTRATSIIAFILTLPFVFLFALIYFVFTFWKTDAQMQLGFYIAMLAILVLIVVHFINIIVVFRNYKGKPAEGLLDDELDDLLA